jgi:hypothetical protein
MARAGSGAAARIVRESSGMGLEPESTNCHGVAAGPPTKAILFLYGHG